MRDFLAERLLIKIMNWTPEETSKERPLLQALASFKYNNYQQFSTGIRFIESLARWLNQFTELNERIIAYDFIKKHLLFISNEQMSYLVSIVFNDKIKPFIVNKTAAEISIDKNFIQNIIISKEYKSNLRKSLFIGLSDGSRIDQLRRSCNINNEQVSTTHEISKEKVDDLLNELHKSERSECKFNTIFLVDDFTASGISYFRHSEGKGKLWKFLDKVFSKDEDWDRLTLKKNLSIYIIFYLATEGALLTLQTEIDKWKNSINIENEITVDAIQIIGNNLKEEILANQDFMRLAEKYFDDKIIDRHYKKGKHDKPFLGFNECALPLVLNHNTPNNSFPILWLPDDMKYKGLFPRVTRHR